MAKKDEQLNLRISGNLKADLVRMAKAEDRSVVYVVERILREYVEGSRGEAPHKSAKGQG